MSGWTRIAEEKIGDLGNRAESETRHCRSALHESWRLRHAGSIQPNSTHGGYPIPLLPTLNARMAESVDAAALKAEFCRFESCCAHHFYRDRRPMDRPSSFYLEGAGSTPAGSSK